MILGAIAGVFGTRGWLRVRSETRPRDGIFNYTGWLLGAGDAWRPYRVRQSRRDGAALLVKLDGVDDRNAAEALLGLHIAVETRELPPPPSGSYYWRDLIGLEVVTLDDRLLGTVRGLIETGASDVLRVRGEREQLIPFVPGVYVMEVDLGARRLVVDWQEDD